MRSRPPRQRKPGPSAQDWLSRNTCTIHEILEADAPGHIRAVGFNGVAEAVNPATGQMTNATILSVVTEREAFEAINLAPA